MRADGGSPHSKRRRRALNRDPGERRLCQCVLQSCELASLLQGHASCTAGLTTQGKLFSLASADQRAKDAAGRAQLARPRWVQPAAFGAPLQLHLQPCNPATRRCVACLHLSASGRMYLQHRWRARALSLRSVMAVAAALQRWEDAGWAPMRRPTCRSSCGFSPSVPPTSLQALSAACRRITISRGGSGGEQGAA